MLLRIITAGPTDLAENKGNEKGRNDLNAGQRSLFSSPLKINTRANRNQAHAKSGQTSETKIGIQLASDGVLLPFLDRPKEVEELIKQTESGKELFCQLEKVFQENHKDEWKFIKETLFDKGRDQLNDFDWLKSLRSIILQRSPRLWCHLSECVGAREFYFVEEMDGNDDDLLLRSPEIGSDVFVSSDSTDPSAFSPLDSSPIFEILKQVHPSFRKPFNAIKGEDFSKTSTGKLPPGFNLSIQEEEEVKKALERDNHAVAGICIRWLTNDKPSLGLHSPSTEPLQFKKQRRLSDLILHSDHQTPSKDIRSWIGSSASSIGIQHRRHRSQSMEQGNETVLPLTSPIDEDQFGTRGRNRGSTESAVGGGLFGTFPRHAKWQPFHLQPSIMSNKRFSMSSVPDHPNKEAKSDRKQNLSGLLPDGRTRHPSAGGNEKAMKESLYAFRKENQLSSSTPSSSEASDGSEDSKTNSGANSPIAHETLFSSTPPPPIDALMISPMSESSDRSMPQTPRDQQQSMFSFTPLIDSHSGDYVHNPEEENQSKFLSSSHMPNTLNEPGSFSSNKKKEAYHKHSHKPSSIIFPIAPTAGVSRVEEMLHDLNKAFDQADQKLTFLKVDETIGEKGIEHIKMIIKRSGERNQTTDEELVKKLAGICFGLVDMDLAIEGHQMDPAAINKEDLDSNKLRLAEETVQKRPWYQKQNEIQHEATEEDLIFGIDTVETKEDREIREQIYYENVEAYENRWNAFSSMLTKIWNVDHSIMNIIHQRCGPVCQLNFQSNQSDSSNQLQQQQQQQRSKMANTMNT